MTDSMFGDNLRLAARPSGRRKRVALVVLTLAALVSTLLVGNHESAAGAGVAAISAGGDHTCTITSSGGVKCWGYNAWGELGDGTKTTRTSPIDVVGLTSVVAISSGSSHTCALTTAGGVKCWGNNSSTQLGDGTGTTRTSPVDVVGLATGVKSISAGDGHTCALMSLGGVKCWGRNDAGQLGDGTTDQRITPVEVTGTSSGIDAISAGWDHTCALTSAGGAKCWGRNHYGQLGDGTTTYRTTPIEVPGLTSGVAAISAGGFHTCALTTSGGVKCWGRNFWGQLGDGTQTNQTSPGDVVGLVGGVAAISAAYAHTCALTSLGGAKCWGRNDAGQLGDGTTTADNTGRPLSVDVVGLSIGVIAVSGGWYHTCALTTLGGVKCWGLNDRGQIGDGTSADNRTTPVDVVALDWKLTFIQQPHSGVLGAPFPTPFLTQPVVAVQNAGGTTMAIDNATQVTLSVGSGPGPLSCTGGLTKTVVSGLATFSGCSVSVAGNYILHVVSSPLHTPTDTAVFSVSPAPAARLGFTQQPIGGVSGTPFPVQPVVAVQNAGGGTINDDNTTRVTLSVASGPGSMNCTGGLEKTAVNGVATFVGCNVSVPGSYVLRAVSSPALAAADSASFDISAAPAPADAKAISASYGHTCALTFAGRAKCWGRNTYGQVGDGTTTSRGTPVDVVGLPLGVVAISAGWNHTCALTSTGDVKCWGYNAGGQLGDGTTTHRATPVSVVGLASGVAAISAGFDHTCALMSSGAVKCWGANFYGQLGDGTTSSTSTPVDVVGMLSGVTAISGGYQHVCALTFAGAMKCWGNNGSGKLGDGTTTHRNSPVGVLGLSGGVDAISVGASHSCASMSSGGLKCWGWNGRGQLGDGTTIQRTSPVDVAGLSGGVTSTSAGQEHTCALTSAGGVRCWGSNSGGLLGDGSTIDRITPTDVVGLTSGVAAISSGVWHMCALTYTDGVQCWGTNVFGQLGDGTTIGRTSPVNVIGLPGLIKPLIPGAHGALWTGSVVNTVRSADGRTLDLSLPPTVTAVFNWVNGAQSFKFWFRGFPLSFNTLQDLQPGNYYFFQATGPTTITVPNPDTFPIPGPGGSFTTVAGATGQLWRGSQVLAPAITASLPVGVTAVFGWDNPSQQFRFWFRGFPDNFNTLNPGIVHGGYYFFQAADGVNVPTN